MKKVVLFFAMAISMLGVGTNADAKVADYCPFNLIKKAHQTRDPDGTAFRPPSLTYKAPINNSQGKGHRAR